MVNMLMIKILLAALAAGGIAYVFVYPLLSGERRALKRQMSFQNPSEKQALRRKAEATSRRKQVEGSLKEIAGRKGKKKTLTLAMSLNQAGLEWSEKTYYIFSAAMAVLVAALMYMPTGQILYALPGIFIGGFGVPRWALSFLAKRRIKNFIEELPNALDVITRGIKSGLPLGDCLRIIASESVEPVKSEFRRTVEAQMLGLTIPEAIEGMAERIPITEVKFFSIVISVQSKAGGNLSESLGNLSSVLRERKKMKNKIQALSMEAKASGVILGSMPFAVLILVYFSNPMYISKLWTTDMGKMALLGAGFWVSIGIFSMKKIINFDI